jgi:NAD(P)-dependent dehydrogenase (short-subunit alcohol dehydrogenase family)
VNLAAHGKRVLITAGAAGIGYVIARTFREAGARVHICDIDKEALSRAKPELADQSLADVAKLGDVDRLFHDVERSLGGLDVLVNNAGIAGPTAKVEDIAPEDWERCIAVDLTGMFYCTRKAMPMIKAAGGGSIINLSSAAGRHGFPHRTPYAAAKWGVVGFTKSLAVEAGPEKVRVNCLLPGIVEGERIERVIAAKAKAHGVSQEEFRQRFLETTSLRSTVSPQDIANMALYLASDAGARITGQAISVDADVRYLV